MGLAALVAPLLGKLLAGAAVVVALLAAYFGIKRKGVVEERARQQLAQTAARDAVQAKVDDARDQDRAIDAAAAAHVAELDRQAAPPSAPTAAPPKPGDRFQF